MEKTNNNTTREIDVLGLLIQIFKSWISLLVFIVLGVIFGVIIAKKTPKTYTSDVILAPEVSSSSIGLNGNLADMASNFGIDLNNKSSIDAIYPDLYPNILGSSNFIYSLFDVPVRLKDNDSIRSYKQHLLKDEKKSPLVAMFGILRKKKSKAKDAEQIKDLEGNRFYISKDDNIMIDAIRGNTVCTVDKKTSIITISVTDQDPLVAAILADTIQHRLQTYITHYKTKKAQNDYVYYRKLAREAKAKYLEAQHKYATFSDANTDADLQSIRTKESDLENDMQLKYNIYTQMEAQANQAQAKIQETTPAFTMIQSPLMPYKASSTPRAYIVLGIIFLFFLLDCIWVLFIKKFISKKLIKKEINIKDLFKRKK